MKIGIDARLYQETGVGRYIRNLIFWLNRLDKKNEYVLFLNSKFKDDLLSSLNWQIVTVNLNWHSFREQIIFPKIISDYRLDLMHFPYFSVPLLYRGKYIVTIHDLTNLLYPTGKATTLPYLLYKFKHLAYRKVLNNALCKAQKIIVPSRSVYQCINRYYPTVAYKVVVTCEGGINISKDTSFGHNLIPFILYVGNVYPHKNIERLLEAFEKIVIEKKYNKLKLLIVGKPDYFQKRLKNNSLSKELGKNIVFIEKITDEELSALYQNAKCLVFPSISEGFGLPALEAMQHGCPIACSNIHTFHEICQDTPFYFNPYNPEDIKKQIINILLLSSSQKEMVQKKEKQLAAKFSWEKMAEKTKKVYEEVNK